MCVRLWREKAKAPTRSSKFDSLSSGPNISPSLYMGTSHISFFYAGYGRRE